MTRYLNAKNGIEILHDSGVTQILAGEHPPNEVGVDAHLGSIYMCSCTSGTIYKKSGLSDFDWTPDWDFQLLKTFNSLLDTPVTYSGQVGKYPRVNASGTGIEYDYIEFDLEAPEAPLIPDTAISGTYLVNFEGGRLLVGATGNKPDLVYDGPIGGLAFGAGKDEACYGSFKIPSSWNTDSDILFTINFMNDLAQTGVTNCSWKLDYHAYADGDIYSDKTTTTVNLNLAIENNALAGTFHSHTLIVDSDDINNTINRGDIVTFKFYRNGASASDTVIGDAVLIALMVEMQTGQHIVGDA